MHITLIGISDQKRDSFSKEITEAIASADRFAGGKRHLELVEHLLPIPFEWTNITVPLTSFFETMKTEAGNWVVFASGDPLFFGIGNTLKREFPEAEIIVYPTFNSLQQLAHRIGLAYGLFRTVSLTGRDWTRFDAALIGGEERLALLTDRTKTPNAIAQRMLHFGYSNYTFWVGEHVGGEAEKIRRLTVAEAAQETFTQPNCLFLEQTEKQKQHRGIPDDEFEGLPNRPKMITKMAIRITTLALLNLNDRSVFWDVGACTGSISIEAKRQNPMLAVRAFEKREESEGIISRNCQKFGTPGIDMHIGDYLAIDKTDFAKPDVVFLGGYGGAMEAVLDDIDRYLSENGSIAFNAVSDESRERFIDWSRQNGYQITTKTKIAVDDFNPITILVVEKARS